MQNANVIREVLHKRGERGLPVGGRDPRNMKNNPTGELDDGKLSRPVREGAIGKVPAIAR